MIENLLNKYFPVLDNGFCAVVDYMGNDQSIARAARCSYGPGTKIINDDRGLIRHLIRMGHSSPLEMCEIKLHVGMPIFVMRQWVRHRTCSMNEFSSRYSILPMLFYTPEKSRHNIQSKKNKQGSEENFISDTDYKKIKNKREHLREEQREFYQMCIESDLTRELARLDLPVTTYTYAYWKMDVNNLIKFLKLRMDEHAQWEIRQYANIISGIVKEWLPITWEAFNDYIRGGLSFSRQEQFLLYRMINNKNISTDLLQN
jgi:thymidylate synthase (FAD)